MSFPLWKIKRELARPLHQLRQLPARLTSLFFSQSYYDRVLAPKKRVTIGAQPATGKYAVYLMFPQSGLLASHREALRYLSVNGYAPVVVSNLPLTEADRAAVLESATLLIERPNYGYDFGGYRDGVLEIASRYQDVSRLVLLNDSAWFPLPGSTNWLMAAEALNRDFVGAATNFGHARVDPERFCEIRWNYCCANRNFHYCSFALMISGTLFSEPGFQRFWKGFPLTNNKTVTVRRGEIGLTQWVIRNGYSHGSTLEVADLDAKLATFSTEELHRLAAATIIPEMARMKEVKAKTLAGTPSREELIALILTSIARQGISYTQPGLVHETYGFAFLKKSPLWLDEEASDLTLSFTKSLHGDFGTTIEAEAKALRRARGARFAPLAD